MAKQIDKPIDITIEPRVRAVLRRFPNGSLNTVSDVQNVIAAMSSYTNHLRHNINELQIKIVSKKKALTEKDTVIIALKADIKELLDALSILDKAIPLIIEHGGNASPDFTSLINKHKERTDG